MTMALTGVIFGNAHPLKPNSPLNKPVPFGCKTMRSSQLRHFKTNEQGLVFKKALFRAFKLLGNQYLLKLEEEAILGPVFEACQHTGIAFKSLQDIWCRVKKRRFGMALRTKSFSRIITTISPLSPVPPWRK